LLRPKQALEDAALFLAALPALLNFGGMGAAALVLLQDPAQYRFSRLPAGLKVVCAPCTRTQ
jgi:hypothetical protein